jgi:hypothetical protein
MGGAAVAGWRGGSGAGAEEAAVSDLAGVWFHCRLVIWQWNEAFPVFGGFRLKKN